MCTWDKNHFHQHCYTKNIKGEHTLRVFGKSVLKIFGAKREEDGSWRKLHNNEYYSLYSSPNFVRMIISKRMR
jgi:hypothetical protein